MVCQQHVLEEKSKGKAMVHWINIHQNNSFINRQQLPLLCGKSGAVALALLGLTADRQGQNSAKFRNFKKLYTRKNIQFFTVLDKGTALL